MGEYEKKQKKTKTWIKKVTDFMLGEGDTPQAKAIREHNEQLRRAAEPVETEPGNMEETNKNYKKAAERN